MRLWKILFLSLTRALSPKYCLDTSAPAATKNLENQELVWLKWTMADHDEPPHQKDDMESNEKRAHV